ncbi:MAG: PIG-L deacetylase family protein [Nitrososphaerales archaeon]
MEEKLRIMNIVCHPADAIDHAGGTLCLHAERGDEVSVVVVTHGVDTHHHKRNEALHFASASTPDDLKVAMDEKEAEVVNGLSILGVHDVRFLRFPDELVLANQALIEAIAEQLADVQPHILILHNPGEEPGSGHGETAQAALAARGLANAPRRHPRKYSIRAFPVQIYFCEMYGTTTQLTMEGMRYGNVLIDITPVVDRKVRAMDCLTSQFYPGNLARKCVEDVNGRMGLHWRLPYAEAFQAHNPSIYDHLPLNPYLLKVYTQPISESEATNRIMVTEVPFEPARA